ncbi:hypothetical protein AALA98_03080 [Lachnospiraceae bacterium 45-W7]
MQEQERMVQFAVHQGIGQHVVTLCRDAAGMSMSGRMRILPFPRNGF